MHSYTVPFTVTLLEKYNKMGNSPIRITNNLGLIYIEKIRVLNIKSRV